MKGIGLVGNAPGLPDRRGVARRPQHYFGALVCTLTRHLRKHAVMADNQREFCALWPVDHGNPEVARLPGLRWNPWVHLAVIEPAPAHVANHKPGVVSHASGVQPHDRKAPPDAIFHASLLESLDLRPVDSP